MDSTLFFSRELLSPQTTHRNGSVLFGKALPLRFQKVQNHFCGWSVSRAIRNQNWPIFLWILQIWHFDRFLIFYFRDKIDRFWSQIARLTDQTPKGSCTLWKGLVLRISKSTSPFRWVVWELSNSRSKTIDFIAKNIKFSRGWKNSDLKQFSFFFYTFNQGPVFCKHPNF